MVNGLRLFWVKSLRQSWPAYFLVLLFFILGVAAGTYGVEKLRAEQVQELGLYLDRFLQQAGMIEVDASKAMREALYNDMTTVLAVYLLGLTVIGVPVMLGLLFARGFVLGFTIHFLAREKNVEGVILACAAILPQNIFLVPALLMGGVASLSFSLLLGRRFFNTKVQVWPSFVVYSGFMLLIAACFAGAVLVEVYLTPLLVRLAAHYMF